MQSRLTAVVGFAALLAALSGCEPWPVPPDRSQASMSIDFGAEGGADVRLILGGQIVTHAPLQHTGEAAAAALFPNAARRSVSVGGNDGGYPLVHIHAAGVYKRGAHPVVSIDTRPALGVLASMGYRNVDVEIGAPGVPTVASWRTAPDLRTTAVGRGRPSPPESPAQAERLS